MYARRLDQSIGAARVCNLDCNVVRDAQVAQHARKLCLHERRVRVLRGHVDEALDATCCLDGLLEVGVVLERIDHRLDVGERLGGLLGLGLLLCLGVLDDGRRLLFELDRLLRRILLGLLGRLLLRLLHRRRALARVPGRQLGLLDRLRLSLGRLLHRHLLSRLLGGALRLEALLLLFAPPALLLRLPSLLLLATALLRLLAPLALLLRLPKPILRLLEILSLSLSPLRHHLLITALVQPHEHRLLKHGLGRALGLEEGEHLHQLGLHLLGVRIGELLEERGGAHLEEHAVHAESVLALAHAARLRDRLAELGRGESADVDAGHVAQDATVPCVEHLVRNARREARLDQPHRVERAAQLELVHHRLAMEHLMREAIRGHQGEEST